MSLGHHEARHTVLENHCPVQRLSIHKEALIYRHAGPMDSGSVVPPRRRRNGNQSKQWETKRKGLTQEVSVYRSITTVFDRSSEAGGGLKSAGVLRTLISLSTDINCPCRGVCHVLPTLNPSPGASLLPTLHPWREECIFSISLGKDSSRGPPQDEQTKTKGAFRIVADRHELSSNTDNTTRYNTTQSKRRDGAAACKTGHDLYDAVPALPAPLRTHTQYLTHKKKLDERKGRSCES